MFNTADVATGPALGAQINYDVNTDLAPISLVAFAPLTLFVNPSVPANTLPEFIAHVKANPGKLHYASSGTGAPNHLGPLLFLQENDLSAVHVPYKGGGPGMLDVVAGRVLFAMQTMTAVRPQAQEGKSACWRSPRRSVRRFSPKCRPSTRPACQGSRSATGSA